MHNVPQFIQLCVERKFPIEGIRMEVIDVRDEGDEHKGIITLLDERHFVLEWCKWDCFLALLAHLKFGSMFMEFIPYCVTECLPHYLGIKEYDTMEVKCDRACKLRVVRSIL